MIDAPPVFNVHFWNDFRPSHCVKQQDAKMAAAAKKIARHHFRT
jgi:hypothetical protein